ncbi:MAG: hypothetical protein F6K11_36735, partial [Leptolyngbya sp. SIO3F4]|nr:hypothetical protein [Leptolyngbya sp. SIO3F4]
SLGGSGYRSDDGPYIGVTFKVNELWDQFGLQQVAPAQQEESLVETDSSPPPEPVSNVPVSETVSETVAVSSDDNEIREAEQKDVDEPMGKSTGEVPQTIDGGEE